MRSKAVKVPNWLSLGHFMFRLVQRWSHRYIFYANKKSLNFPKLSEQEYLVLVSLMFTTLYLLIICFFKKPFWKRSLIGYSSLFWVIKLSSFLIELKLHTLRQPTMRVCWLVGVLINSEVEQSTFLCVF